MLRNQSGLTCGHHLGVLSGNAITFPMGLFSSLIAPQLNTGNAFTNRFSCCSTNGQNLQAEIDLPLMTIRSLCGHQLGNP
jgi:hypothetical protein